MISTYALRMTSFKQAKDLYRAQKQAKKVQKELANIHVEAEAQGVTVVVSGKQEIVSIAIEDDVPRENIPELLKDALNRAMSKAQIVSAEKMQGVMGEMGLPVAGGDKNRFTS